MSLSGLALLITSVGALREIAPDWVRVEMEPREPLKLVAGSRQVLVAVFAGDEILKPDGRRGWYDTGHRTVELAVQILLPPQVEATVEGQTLVFETHEAGAKPLFAAVDGLISRAFGAPERGAWGELWQAFVPSIAGEVEGRPFICGESPSVQIPGLDLSIPCEVLGPPAPGDVSEAWVELIAAMRADAYFAPSASFVAAMIEGNPLPPWRIELAQLGLSRGQGEALGIGPLPGIEALPLAERLSIDTPLGHGTVASLDGEA